MKPIAIDFQAKRANRLCRIAQTAVNRDLLPGDLFLHAILAGLAGLREGDTVVQCEVRRCGRVADYRLDWKTDPDGVAVCDEHRRRLQS